MGQNFFFFTGTEFPAKINSKLISFSEAEIIFFSCGNSFKKFFSSEIFSIIMEISFTVCWDSLNWPINHFGTRKNKNKILREKTWKGKINPTRELKDKRGNFCQIFKISHIPWYGKWRILPSVSPLKKEGRNLNSRKFADFSIPTTEGFQPNSPPQKFLPNFLGIFCLANRHNSPFLTSPQLYFTKNIVLSKKIPGKFPNLAWNLLLNGGSNRLPG